MKTATRVPRCSRTSKNWGIFSVPSMLRSWLAMARWPELEMGKNSVTPWTRPSRMDVRKDMASTLPFSWILVSRPGPEAAPVGHTP